MAPPPTAHKTTRLLTRTELADTFGVMPSTIIKWVRSGMPVAERGGRGRGAKFRLLDVEAWRLQSQKPNTDGDNEQPVNLSLERARLARAQTSKAEIEIAAKQRELLPADEVRRVVGGAFHAVRVRLLALGRSVAERCAVAAQQSTAAIQAVIDDAVHEALTELAEARDMDGDAAREQG